MMGDADLLELGGLFKRAREENKWFETSVSGDIYFFSPDELIAHQEQGRFRWGRPNWTLVPIDLVLHHYQKKIDCAEEEKREIEKRIKKNQEQNLIKKTEMNPVDTIVRIRELRGQIELCVRMKSELERELEAWETEFEEQRKEQTDNAKSDENIDR